jgi:hypothetical protein
MRAGCAQACALGEVRAGVARLRGGRRRVYDVFVPVGFVLFAAFVFFGVWGWISVGPAQEWRNGVCAADAPVAASCRTVGTATVTGTFRHVAASVHGSTVYGVTYTGHGRIPNYSATYAWPTNSSTNVPLPKKGAEIGVTTWQGRPVTLAFDGLVAKVSNAPDNDARTTAIFSSFAAFAAVLIALVGRPLPRTLSGARALRVVDWVWLPLLVFGYVLVVNNLYILGNVAIDVGCVLAFTVSQALRVRVGLQETRHGVEVRDDPAAKPSPGVRAERERRGRRGSRGGSGGCPVAAEQQGWIEADLTGLRTEFGITATSRPTIVPHTTFYPVAFDGNALQVDELVRKVCGTMGVDFEGVRVQLIDGGALRDRRPEDARAPYAGHFNANSYDADSGLYVIELDQSLAEEPPVLTAVLAHELAHVRLDRKQRIGEEHRELERHADLLTIACGMGLFGALVTYRPELHLGQFRPVSLGRLETSEFAYALACNAWLNGEREPTWGKALDEAHRSDFVQGFSYLSQAAGDGVLPTLGGKL